MRSLVRFIFATILVLGIPVLIFTAVPRLNGFTVQKLQHQLAQQQVYDQAHRLIQQQSDGLQSDAGANDQSDSESELSALIFDNVTPTYLQTKTEEITTQTSDWLTGRSEAAPTLSLNDLREQIVAQDPEAQAQIQALLVELRQAQEANQGQLPQVSADPESQQQVEGLLRDGATLDQLEAGDWRFSLQQPLQDLPQLYRLYIYSLPVLGILLLASLVGLMLTGTSWQQRFKNIGWVLVAAAVWNGILAAIFGWVVMGAFVRILPGPEDAPLVRSIVIAVQQSVLDQYLVIQLVATIALLVLGMVLLIGCQLVQRRQAKPAELHPETESTQRSAQQPEADKGQPKAKEKANA